MRANTALLVAALAGAAHAVAVHDYRLLRNEPHKAVDADSMRRPNDAPLEVPSNPKKAALHENHAKGLPGMCCDCTTITTAVTRTRTKCMPATTSTNGTTTNGTTTTGPTVGPTTGPTTNGTTTNGTTTNGTPTTGPTTNGTGTLDGGNTTTTGCVTKVATTLCLPTTMTTTQCMTNPPTTECATPPLSTGPITPLVVPQRTRHVLPGLHAALPRRLHQAREKGPGCPMASPFTPCPQSTTSVCSSSTDMSTQQPPPPPPSSSSCTLQQSTQQPPPPPTSSSCTKQSTQQPPPPPPPPPSSSSCTKQSTQQPPPPCSSGAGCPLQQTTAMPATTSAGPTKPTMMPVTVSMGNAARTALSGLCCMVAAVVAFLV